MADDTDPVLEEALGYLRDAREAILWKLEGISEYDARRPLTPTGTNLLGLVKHLALVEHEYLGELLGHPIDLPAGWSDVEEANTDMWVSAQEPRELVVETYRAVAANTEVTLRAVGLDHRTEVPDWPPQQRQVDARLLLLHTVAETHRHAGHADIVRELIDGLAGMRHGNSNLPEGDAVWWARYRDRVEDEARTAGGVA